MESNCLAMLIKYAWMEHGSTATPCCNVPIICGLCLSAGNPSTVQPAQWRYNMEEHLAAAHPEYASPLNAAAPQHLPHTVWMSMATTYVERALGIPPSKIPPAFTRVAGPDEPVDEPGQQLGVQCHATARRAPTGKPALPKKRKVNSGAVVAVASGSGSK
jgi:hypothetical protein